MVMADSWDDGSVVQMRKIIYTFIALVFFFVKPKLFWILLIFSIKPNPLKIPKTFRPTQTLHYHLFDWENKYDKKIIIH